MADDTKKGKGQRSPQEKTVDRSKAKIENFNKLAPKRMDRALKALEVVGNLANRNSYTYTDAQVAKMYNALAESVNRIKVKFAAPHGKQETGGFSF